ncbi:PQQ-dependent sugar dehydrogenase [Marinospirillum alkaliphilum]|uniref:Glucose/arabinose dehydrogenase, beta-propeller fold n=1 Tax=Marinospirillum alkaliphilum DSM 21637 TaxID=1122209 RepID=A0A1K1UFQ9_9GAMM|nr:PQQ-dependent sugar dehydrogenase [Marinospirillum alkaliphilum]SFX11607.1 Glucose/arabinose dehydrogenase, beta-propeller fold [Marinospirillum alkaliphilum DSM 21637]
MHYPGLLVLCLSLVLVSPVLQARVLESDLYPLQVEQLTDGLENPWSLVFLPEGEVLITERPGRLRRLIDGQLMPQPVSGLPPVHPTGQGGLLDLALHPDFEQNRWLYFSYVDRNREGYTTRVARGVYRSGRLSAVEVIFTAEPRSSGGRHFGSRLVFDHEGYLYITIGDRGEMQRAQDPADHAGSVIRLHADGRIPDTNPGVLKSGWRPEIYAIGTRNAQGMALHPETGEVWLQEHGPRGGDEVNRIQAGLNYGWPEVTHGRNYTGTSITPHQHLPGMESPLWHWTPSIAPSGMMFYTGELFPAWQGQLLVGALAGRLISRLEVSGSGDDWQVAEQERFFQVMNVRVRDVRQAPDGSIWVLTDDRNGQLLRLSPADRL